MQYPHLDYAKAIHPHKNFDIEDTLIVQALENSKGQPEMSNQDMKVALVSLLTTCKWQQDIIDELVVCVNELRSSQKKSWFNKK